MNSPTCSQCDCVKGCSANLSLCPILGAECIASSQVSAAQIEAHRVLDAAIAQPAETALAWRCNKDRLCCKCLYGTGICENPLIPPKRNQSQEAQQSSAMPLTARPIDALWAAHDAEEAAELAQLQEQQIERNFCSRCGKRLVNDGIHTCTPPKDKP